ncbi:MAG: class II aldolase/adducin family protein [Solirubrobacteraceae bacterium]
MQLRRHREQVADACRALAAAGLVRGTSGNLSARDGDLIAVTPTGGVLAEMTPDDVSVVGLDGTLVEGSPATSEVALHLGVYERYGAGAVVHTHAPMATALSCVLDELPCVHYEMLALGGTVRVAPYTTFGTDALAASVLDALDGRTAAMMANHGTVTFGADVTAAVAATELLEWASTVYWRAAQVGTPRVLSEEDRAAVVDAVVARGYGKR